MREIHLAAHQSMEPMLIDAEGFVEQVDVALLVASAHKDHRAPEWSAKVKLEARGKAASGGGRFSSGGGFGAMSRDIACGDGLQACDIVAVMTAPDLALPQAVEALDGILEARLAWWGKYGNDLQGQTQAADTPDTVSKSVPSLKDRIVVELCVGGQPFAAPALDQNCEGSACAWPLHWPGVGQRAMQAGRSEHRDKRPTSDLQILDEVKAVQLGLAGGQIGQIPALGRRGPALPMRTVEHPVTRKYPVDRRALRDSLNISALMQRQADRVGSVLAQHAALAQVSSHAQDMLFQGRRRAVPGPTGLQIREAHPVHALAASACNPVSRRAHTDPELLGYRSQALPLTYRPNQLAAALFKRRFLAMTDPSKIQERYITPRPREHMTTSWLITPRCPYWHALPARRRARGGISGRPTGSLRFLRPHCLPTTRCSTNAATRVFNQRCNSARN